MYLFDDLGSHLQNLTPPHVPTGRYSTVAMAPVVFVQWSFVTFHSIFIPNPWCSSYHAHTNQSLLLKHGSSPPTATPPTTCREATVASVWRLSRTPPSQQGTNLLRRYRCFRLTFIPNSFKRNQQLAEKLPLLPFDTHPKLLHKEEAFPACIAASVRHTHRPPVVIHVEEALPAPSAALSVRRLPWTPLQD